MRVLIAALLILLASTLGTRAAWGDTVADSARAAIRVKQFSKAIELLRSAAGRGEAESQYLLGLACATGMGVELSLPQAEEWLTRAAGQSHAEAAYALAGLLAVRGSTGPAREWRNRAAQLGHPLARELEGRQQLPMHAQRATGADAPSEMEALLWAMRYESANALQSLNVSRPAGPDLSVQDAFGRSVLAHATVLGSTEVVRQLVAAGVRADGVDRFGTTVLMLAAQGENLEVLETVLPLSRVDARDDAGNTALMYAARRGRTAMVSGLIRAGAGLDITNADGWTALDLARRGEHAEVVSVLLGAGAPGRARRQGDVAGLDPTRKGEMYRHWPELAIAASRDDAKTVASLLSGGASPNERTPAGDTPLLVAAKSCSAQVVEPLIRAGASVDVNDASGASAFAIAARQGDLAVLDALLTSGAAKLNKQVRSTALLEATGARQTTAVRRLLEAGVDVNAAGRDGVTALMIAVRLNDRGLIEALLARQPSLAMADREGRTAMWHAAASASGDAVALLLDAGAKADETTAMTSPLMAAVRAGHIGSVRQLLRGGAPVNPADPSAATPLLAAAQAGSTAMIDALIAAGADVNRQDEAGDTALIVAARGGHVEACQVLLRAGANASLRNDDRLSALDVARRSRFNDLVSLLD